MLSTWGCATFPKPTLDLQFEGATSLDSRIGFTRGSQATLFDSAGTLVYAKHNLLLQSQTFQTSWTATRSSLSTDATTAPDGTLTADQLIEDTTASNTHIIFSADVSVPAAVVLVYSVYLKPTGRTWVNLQIATGSGAYGATVPFCYFNLSGAGTVGSAGAATGSITAVGNGWYRCVVTAVVTTSASTTNLRIKLATADGTDSYTGDGTSGVFLWGAQLNLSNMEGGVTSSLTTYYPTTTAAYYGPRFDYDPSTLAARGLLIEEARTNSIRNNTMQGAVAGTPGTLPTNWTGDLGTGQGLTMSIPSIATINGIQTFNYRVNGTTTSPGAGALQCEPNNQIAAAPSQTWTGSYFLALVGGSFANLTSLNISIREFDVSGVFLRQTMQSITGITSSLSRISVTATTGVNTAFVSLGIRGEYPTGVAIDYTLRIGLPQLELGAFATSVIPTTTTALTRNADVASMTGTNFSSWYNQSAGTFLTVYSLARPSSGLNQFTARASDNTYNNAIAMNTSNTGFAQIATASGGVFDGLASASPALTANVTAKVAGCYAANDLAISLNGAAVVTDTSATIPTALTRLDIGSDHAGVNRIQGGYIQRISYYPSRLPNGTLQALTA